MRKFLVSRALFLPIIFVISQTFIFSQNQWLGNTSANWDEPSNWSQGTVPNINTSVTIDANVTFYPEISTNVTVDNISISGTGQLIILKSGTLTINGTVAGARLFLDNSSEVTNYGTVTIESNSTNVGAVIFAGMGTLFKNYGILTSKHNTFRSVELNNGILQNYAGGNITIMGGNRGLQVTTNGKLINDEGGTISLLNFPATLNTNSALFLQGGTTAGNTESIKNSGTIFSNKMECFGSTFNNKECGAIFIRNGQFFNQTGNVFNNQGILTIDSDASFPNNGNFTNNATFTNTGLFKAKNNPTYVNNGYRIYDILTNVNGASNDNIIEDGTSANIPSRIAGNVFTFWEDSLCTLRAGTFNSATNIFTPTLSGGNYKLFIKLTPQSLPNCPLIMPFLYTKEITAPTFALQPSTTIVDCIGNNIMVPTRVTDFTSVKWQSAPMGSNTYTDLIEAAPYRGVTNDTLYIDNVDQSLSGINLRCVATGISPFGSTNSSVGTLSILAESTITAVATIGTKTWASSSSWVEDRVPNRCDLVIIPAGVTMRVNASATVRAVQNNGTIELRNTGTVLRVLE